LEEWGKGDKENGGFQEGVKLLRNLPEYYGEPFASHNDGKTYHGGGDKTRMQVYLHKENKRETQKEI
jgi:hypothetical protein